MSSKTRRIIYWIVVVAALAIEWFSVHNPWAKVAMVLLTLGVLSRRYILILMFTAMAVGGGLKGVSGADMRRSSTRSAFMEAGLVWVITVAFGLLLVSLLNYSIYWPGVIISLIILSIFRIAAGYHEGREVVDIIEQSEAADC